MRIVLPIVLLLFGAVNLLIAFLMQLGLPSGYSVKGPNIFYVPFIIGALQVLMAIVSILLSRRSNPPPLKNPTFFRWVLFFTGVLILFGGFVVFNTSIFSPDLFGSERALPQIGVISWLIVSLIVSLILYVDSRNNFAQHPNLMRYFAIAVGVLAAFVTTVQALILIYAVPFEPPSTFPFLSGLMTVAFFPLALLILGLSKDYVSVQKQPKTPEDCGILQISI